MCQSMKYYYDVSDGICTRDSIANYLNTDNVSICQFLYFLDIDDIASYVESSYYADKDWHFRYKISSMIKLIVVKCYRNLSFEKTISTLTKEEAQLLSFEDNNGIMNIPSPATLHHFVKYRLGETGLDEVMFKIGKKISKNTKIRDAKTDSTPLEASRYDKYADYNPHYNCKMDKAHITMIGTLPIYMTHTKGASHDSPELKKHIDALVEMGVDIDTYALDGGYDSFRNHADIWHKLNTKPVIAYSSDSKVQYEGMMERIDHWVNKMWKLGGSIHMKHEEKLHFLYENGREKQVGMHLRNKNIEDDAFDEDYSHRGECERVHKHIKWTVKFDIRGMKNSSKKLYSIMNFVAYQLLVATNLQNEVKETNSFANYV